MQVLCVAMGKSENGENVTEKSFCARNQKYFPHRMRAYNMKPRLRLLLSVSLKSLVNGLGSLNAVWQKQSTSPFHTHGASITTKKIGQQQIAAAKADTSSDAKFSQISQANTETAPEF